MIQSKTVHECRYIVQTKDFSRGSLFSIVVLEQCICIKCATQRQHSSASLSRRIHLREVFAFVLFVRNMLLIMYCAGECINQIKDVITFMINTRLTIKLTGSTITFDKTTDLIIFLAGVALLGQELPS